MSVSLLDGYIAAWNGDDADAVMSYFTPNTIYQDVAAGRKMNASETRTFISDFFNNNVSSTFEKLSECISQEAISWEWRMIVTRDNGQILDRFGISVMEMDGDKIIGNRDYWSQLILPS